MILKIVLITAHKAFRFRARWAGCIEGALRKFLEMLLQTSFLSTEHITQVIDEAISNDIDDVFHLSKLLWLTISTVIIVALFILFWVFFSSPRGGGHRL